LVHLGTTKDDHMSAKHAQARVFSRYLSFVLLPVLAWVETFNGSISDAVTDPSGSLDHVPSTAIPI